MSIVFDEVVGTVEGQEPPREAASPARGPEAGAPARRRQFEDQLRAAHRRMDRLRAT
ncbi:MAG: hypothetical protein H6740_07445 [Alphaproteobacteria bacterium]|nr:hypothetical protein [Alphaproteobacteria bacterium]